MLPLLSMPLFFGATALKTHIPQQNQQAIIYVGENTLVYGVPGVSNAIIVKVQNKTVPQKIEQLKKKFVPSEDQAITKNSKRNQELKVLQQKINKKIKHTFYSSSQDSDLLRFAKVKIASVANSTNFSFKYQKAIVCIDEDLNIFRVQNTKQKFFTSLSYSEFQKPRNSFLRGPPHSI